MKKPSKKPVTAIKHQRITPSDYDYDFFLSYSYEASLRYWIDQFFFPELNSRLTNGLQRKLPPRIFVAKYEIKTGQDWEAGLGSALRRSICLIPVFSAGYSRSKWCQTELRAFLKRETKLKLIRADGTGGLVFPIVFSPGTYKIGRRRQYADFTNFAYTAPAFKESQAYLDFQKAVQSFIEAFTRKGGLLFNPPPTRPWPVRIGRAKRPPTLIRMRKPSLL